jgi:hypothetical protein
MASPPGLEPGTYCLEGSCSIRLSYRDAPPARRAACDGPAGREHSSIWLKMQATRVPAPRWLVKIGRDTMCHRAIDVKLGAKWQMNWRYSTGLSRNITR